jgi:hypothetical protein
MRTIFLSDVLLSLTLDVYFEDLLGSLIWHKIEILGGDKKRFRP